MGNTYSIGSGYEFAAIPKTGGRRYRAGISHKGDNKYYRRNYPMRRWLDGILLRMLMLMWKLINIPVTDSINQQEL
ncbi:MAG: hypothetical protein V2A61_03520 [Calditrichota bacterium]